jgi:hypothetical protein
MSGQQQAGMYKAQAAQYELSARAEELKGRDQADKIRRSLQSTLASQNAAFGARGISLSSGTPVALAATSSNEASRDISLAQFGAGSAANADRSQAAVYRATGRSAKVAGYTNAAMTLASSKNNFGSLISG